METHSVHDPFGKKAAPQPEMVELSKVESSFMAMMRKYKSDPEKIKGADPRGSVAVDPVTKDLLFISARRVPAENGGKGDYKTEYLIYSSNGDEIRSVSKEDYETLKGMGRIQVVGDYRFDPNPAMLAFLTRGMAERKGDPMLPPGRYDEIRGEADIDGSGFFYAIFVNRNNVKKGQLAQEDRQNRFFKGLP